MADDNVLRIEPGAAERIAQAFDTHATNLNDVALRLQNAGFVTGFAGFPSAVELDAGFQNKARLAIAHLRAQADIAREHAATLRAAGATYSKADSASSVWIQAVGPSDDPWSYQG